MAKQYVTFNVDSRRYHMSFRCQESAGCDSCKHKEECTSIKKVQLAVFAMAVRAEKAATMSPDDVISPARRLRKFAAATWIEVWLERYHDACAPKITPAE